MQNTPTQVSSASEQKAQLRVIKIGVGLTLFILSMYCFVAPTFNPELKGRGFLMLGNREAWIILAPLLAVIWAMLITKIRKTASAD